MASADDADLPKAVVKRLAKAALDGPDASTGADAKNVQVNKDALLALSESTKVFILYLTATANAHKAAAHRQTLLESDVYAALSDIQYPEFLQPLKDEVQALKQKTRAKAKAKTVAKQGGTAITSSTTAAAQTTAVAASTEDRGTDEADGGEGDDEGDGDNLDDQHDDVADDVAADVADREADDGEEDDCDMGDQPDDVPADVADEAEEDGDAM